MSKHVFLAVPAYTGQIHLETFRAITGSIVALLQRGDRFTLWDESGSAMIARSRASMLSHFMASGATHCMMIDNDVGFAPDSLLRLVDAPVEFVAGVYPQRKDPIEYSVQWDESKDELRWDPRTELLEVAGVPAGFLCLSRSCVRQMIAAYDGLKFADSGAPGGHSWALFESIRDGLLYYGEDFSFCKRWRDIGGKIWIDPEMELMHVGDKRFTGRIGDYLRRINNIQQPREQAA